MDMEVNKKGKKIPFAKRVFRGEVWWANLGGEFMGSEQTGYRPVLVVQNDIGNKYSSTTIVAMITSKLKVELPTHMDIDLMDTSTILFEQVRTIDKGRLQERIRKLTDAEMRNINDKLKISLGIA